MRGWRLLTILPFAAVVLLAGWKATEPDDRPTVSAAVAAEVVAIPAELLCREYATQTLATVDQLADTFRLHAAAHHAYLQHRIPFGPANRPGTVLNIWRTTLRDRISQVLRYHELRDAWRGLCDTTGDLACREWGRATLGMADLLDRAFKQHADAHVLYRAKKLAYGAVNQPGTVLWIWARTLHDGIMHARHYQQLRRTWQRACLPQET